MSCATEFLRHDDYLAHGLNWRHTVFLSWEAGSMKRGDAAWKGLGHSLAKESTRKDRMLAVYTYLHVFTV